MIPYKTLIQIDRKSKQALYIQLTNQLIQLIKSRTLPPKAKLPSTRVLSELIGIHRKTIVASYDELIMQGWVISIPKKGTYVNEDIPVLQQRWTKDILPIKPEISGFSFSKNAELERTFPQDYSEDYMYVNDGISDERLTPVGELGTLYRKISNKAATLAYMSYGTTYGNIRLREALVQYLNETRGLNVGIENILITRGSQMGMFLASQLLIDTSTSGCIIIGETNYSSADTTFQYANAKLLRVEVDENGLNTEAVEKLLKQHNVKAVYVTSHHHHPTTVTLSAQRRMHLLSLSKTYGFAILEDDYDYDFHYNHAPILPLASHDVHGNVIYVGSVCKTVAPVYRVGYLIASKDFVDECAKLRRFIDRQGDAILELTFASFIKNGSLDRHINKVKKCYKVRRDFFCELLVSELGDYLHFQIPKGGMAIWVTLHKNYTWGAVAKIALKYKLVIPEWQRYDMANIKHNAIRIGFAKYTKKEALELVSRLKKTLLELA